MFPFQDFLTPPPPTPTLPGGPAAQAAPLPTPLPTTAPAPTSAQIPGAPTAPLDTTNLAAIVALLIYLAFFGAIGYRRGARRELWVFAVAVLLAFGLRQFSEVILKVVDRFGKGLAFITGQEVPEQSALGAWAKASPENTTTLLLLLWFGGVVLTYILTNHFVRKSRSDGWAVLLGILNGIVFATIFAPLLTTLIFPNTAVEGPMIQLPVWSFVTYVWQEFIRLLSQVGNWLGPAAINVIFLAIVVLVLIAAFTLRTSAKPKS